MTSEDTTVPTEAFWETFYRDRDQVWSGKPNVALVREVASVTPGTALDLGCGEGADAVWLAEQGWRVTAVDVSPTALERAAAHAAEAGVADRITWEQRDLATSFPSGTFDLVSAQYFHSPVEGPGERDGVLRLAARAVAPGGVLLVVGHAAPAPWEQDEGDAGCAGVAGYVDGADQATAGGAGRGHGAGHGATAGGAGSGHECAGGADHVGPAGHDGADHVGPAGHAHLHLPTPEEVLATVGTEPGPWDVVVSREFEREMVGPDGVAAARADNVLLVRRVAG